MPGYSREDAELGRCTLVVTCAVIRQGHGVYDGAALILKRSPNEKEGPGLWTIPGGKVQTGDLGEPARGVTHNLWSGVGVFERAILREIKEEAGIEVDFISSMPDRAKIFTRNDGTLTLVLVYWAMCALPVTVTIGPESTAHQWVRKVELDDYEFIGDVKDDIQAAFRALQDYEHELRRPYVRDMD